MTQRLQRRQIEGLAGLIQKWLHEKKKSIFFTTFINPVIGL
jgi:hypothetical protein